MARYTRTGRAGVHTEPCKSGFSDSHNLRRVSNIDSIPINPNTTIQADLTRNNSSWIAEDVPYLLKYEKLIRSDYKTANGRELPMKGKTASTPIRESILNLPNNTGETDAMVADFVGRIENEFGLRCLRWFVHRDEEYNDPDTGESHVNCHAHIVWDWYNWDEHRTFKLGKAAMSRWQDLASEVTGMERGLAVEETGARHVDVAEFKAQQERERAAELKAKNRSLKNEIELHQDQNETLKEENKRIDNQRQQIKACLSHDKEVLEAKASHIPVPQKGRFGYKTSDVDEYIEQTRASAIVRVRSSVAEDFRAEIKALNQEISRLQAVEKEYHQVKESPDALEKLHRLLWTKHKKEFEEKKALATYLFNANAEVKALYFRYFAIVKEQNAELSEQYGQVKEMYDEAKDLYEKYKTERSLGCKIRLFGKMLMLTAPTLAFLLIVLGTIVTLCGYSNKREAKALREDAGALSERLKTAQSILKEEKKGFVESVGLPERKEGRKM